MPKKARSPERSGNPVNATDYSEGSYFKALFGEIPEQNVSSSSLFSENNPFRRKIDEARNPEYGKGLQFRANDFEKEDTSAGPGSSEMKEEKKKRKKERVKEENLDVGEEFVEGGKKRLKKNELKGVKADKDSSSGKSSENTQLLGSEKTRLPVAGKSGDFGVENGKTEKKKKRKRYEVEAEYEARRYEVREEDETKKASEMVMGKRKKMDNPEDTMVEREGFDDESKLLRTVFIGNLPLKIKKKELLKEFGMFGEIESVRIRSVPIMDEKIPRKGAIIQKRFNENANSVNAYIVFKAEDSAKASLAHNMAMVAGNHIRVDRACPPRKKLKGDDSLLYDPKRTIFVGNLPFDVKDEEIYQLFCGISSLASSLEAVRVIRDPGTSLGKGIAYILFKTKDAATSAVRQRNLQLRDRKLRLSNASTAPLKRKSSIAPGTKVYPAKSADNSRTPESGGIRVRAKENLSYQGVRASKSGVEKKAVTYTRNKNPVGSKSQPSSEERWQKKKRPAVAARKRSQNAARNSESKEGASSSKLVGSKRKFGNRTPGSSGGRNKKAKKFR